MFVPVGLGIYLRGRWRADGDLVKAQRWLDEYGRAQHLFVDGGSSSLDEASAGSDAPRTVRAHLHPAAEVVELIETDDGLIASATTSTVGPGYHAWLCETLRALGAAVGVEWVRPASDDDDLGEGDETGYFATGDRAELERQFARWLGALMGAVREHGLDDDGEPMHLMRAMGTPTPLVRAGVATPLGPRDVAWVNAVAGAGDRAAFVGRDLFSWWDGPVNGASMRLGRALYRMWNDVAWRPPLDDDEAYLLDQLLGDLDAAFAADPTLAFPWRAWQELRLCMASDALAYQHVTGDRLAAEIARRASTESGPAIGYRRSDALARVADWSLRIPGSLLQTTDHDGTWLAYDGTRSARLSAFRARDPDRVEAFDEPGDGRDAIWLDRPPLRGRLLAGPNTDGDGWLATGTACVPGRVAAITLTWTHAEEAAWARSTFASLRFVGGA